MNEQKLDFYSFLWSEARLIIASVALFLGGIPPILKILPFPAISGLVGSLLMLAWVISGVVSCYLLYRWWKSGQKIFGQQRTQDRIAFFVNIVSGLNLGITGLSGTNIGMSITYNRGIFILTGLVYVLAAYYLYTRWNKSDKTLFPNTGISTEAAK